MSEEFTQGTWEWDAGIIPPDGPGRYADIYVNGEDGEPIIIAEFNDSIPEGRANAYLITAAPDLLLALESMMPVPLTGNPSRAELIEFWESEREMGRGEADDVLRAYAALAKARGAS